jgi:V8-like Glu-specific endopeptidase
MLRKSHVLVGLAGWIWAVGASSPALAFTVFENDNRVPMTSTKYPWSAVGRLHSPKGGCTGSLVGQSIVLTAAHCILDDRTQDIFPMKGITFYPNLIAGRSAKTAKALRAWVGAFNHGKYREDDWALILIDQPLGDTYGFLGYQPVDFTNWNPLSHSFFLPGYAGDFRGGNTAGVDPSCRVHGADSRKGYMLHDCDMNPGSSGGPMLWDGGKELGWRVIGVNVAHRVDPLTRQNANGSVYSSERANIAVNSSRFESQLVQLRRLGPKIIEEIQNQN